MALTLSIDQERFIDSPDAAKIAKEIKLLKEEQFVILSKSDTVFVQAEIGADSMRLEYRDEPTASPDDAPALFEATNPPTSREELISIFCGFAEGVDDWKERFEWSQLEIVEIDYTIVLAVEADQLGAFDPYDSELRTDFPEISAAGVIALCALVLNQTPESTNSQFAVSEGFGGRWFAASTSVLKALVEFPDDAIEDLAKKWYNTESFPKDAYEQSSAIEMAGGLFDLALEASEQGIILAFCEV
ncbi:MAG: hypothetical protein ACI9G1_003899 [Pirellulaceae bacterium]|jgi:hypothetical protein